MPLTTTLTTEDLWNVSSLTNSNHHFNILLYKERTTFVYLCCKTRGVVNLLRQTTRLESRLVFAYLFDTEAILHAYDNQKADIKVYS